LAIRTLALKADITQMDVDLIVNAANPALAGGGGVDGAIHRAAGEIRLHAACRAIVADRGPLRPGESALTPGFGLKARWIAHAVGPVWRGGQEGEEAALLACYASCLELARGLGVKSLAFPNISTGVYCYPKDLAAQAVSRYFNADPSPAAFLDLVAFACYDDENLNLYLSLFEGASE
jgi:O-acetyl-ADP-ribose deacetylase